MDLSLKFYKVKQDSRPENFANESIIVSDIAGILNKLGKEATVVELEIPPYGSYNLEEVKDMIKKSLLSFTSAASVSIDSPHSYIVCTKMSTEVTEMDMLRELGFALTKVKATRESVFIFKNMEGRLFIAKSGATTFFKEEELE